MARGKKNSRNSNKRREARKETNEKLCPARFLLESAPKVLAQTFKEANVNGLSITPSIFKKLITDFTLATKVLHTEKSTVQYIGYFDTTSLVGRDIQLFRVLDEKGEEIAFAPLVYSPKVITGINGDLWCDMNDVAKMAFQKSRNPSTVKTREVQEVINYARYVCSTLVNLNYHLDLGIALFDDGPNIDFLCAGNEEVLNSPDSEKRKERIEKFTLQAITAMDALMENKECSFSEGDYMQNMKAMKTAGEQLPYLFMHYEECIKVKKLVNNDKDEVKKALHKVSDATEDVTVVRGGI